MINKIYSCVCLCIFFRAIMDNLEDMDDFDMFDPPPPPTVKTLTNSNEKEHMIRHSII